MRQILSGGVVCGILTVYLLVTYRLSVNGYQWVALLIAIGLSAIIKLLTMSEEK